MHMHILLVMDQDYKQLILSGTTSWDEILKRLNDFCKKYAKDEWLIGRGWDQNDWDIKEFPSNEKLNALFPDRPVLLTRIDGHAAIANQKALDIAGVKPGYTFDRWRSRS